VESDTSFREILFYFLGAQEGRGPLMDEKMGMAEVIAAVDAAKAAEREAMPRRWVMPWSQPVGRSVASTMVQPAGAPDGRAEPEPVASE
jgi:hypothetical protein